ncbi:MAG: ABC transporter permease [Candidatus Diapherotrites archaeon]
MAGILTLWKRELLLYTRYKSRIIGSLGVPFFFLVSLGFGLNAVIQTGNVSYFAFLAPGIVGMMLLFNGMFSGLSVIQDRQFGFLKEMLVAPIPRSSIVLGKAFGNATTSVVQGLLVLAIAIILGLSLNWLMLPAIMLTMFLISIGFVALGVGLAAILTDPQGFQFIMNFLVFPLFLLSGALFPLSNSPPALQTVAYVDPLTYGVDALRGLALGANHLPLWIDFTVIIAFSVAMVLIATWLFRRMQ